LVPAFEPFKVLLRNFETSFKAAVIKFASNANDLLLFIPMEVDCKPLVMSNVWLGDTWLLFTGGGGSCIGLVCNIVAVVGRAT